MNKYYFRDNNGVTWERITKQKAKKAYNNNIPVVFCPCNLRPFGFWQPGVIITNSSGETFETYVNCFEFYNCINNETGKYTSFYIKTGGVKND